ncbi:MAG: suppressor of fused domain protein, partial [Zoogloeaceae bacterium]|nr:suppressor of fused domain protein [Zoogloeaceae bacterium]
MVEAVVKRIEDDFGHSRFLWQSVLAEMRARYPGQREPLHWSSLLPRPVNGTLGHIGVFDGGDFFHFVTEGFSEILPPNPEDGHRRYELEMRLVKTAEVDEAEIHQMCVFLRFLAELALRYRDLAAFRPFALYGCGRPIDKAERSRISGLVLVRHTTALPEQDSPRGKITFLTLVGLSGDELEAIFHERVKLSFLLEKTELRTDFARSDWVWTVGDALTLA